MPVEIQADRDRVVQIIVNLLNNAVRYTPPGGSIWLKTTVETGHAVMRVEDTGEGIPRENLERVFERFYRLDRGRTREVGGTGLGLAIVKHLAEAMDGSVGVGPASPQGSIFWVRLASAQE